MINQFYQPTQDAKQSSDTRSGSVFTKKITKYSHQDFYDNGKLFRFQDDPQLYRKARKRLQNRQSSIKVRYLKKKEDQLMQIQTEQLKIKNRQLQIQNASLLSQNKVLRQRVVFLQKIAQGKIPSPSTSLDSQVDQLQENCENWQRSSVGSSLGGNWNSFFLVTLIFAIILIPKGSQKSDMTVALSVNGTACHHSHYQQQSFGWQWKGPLIIIYFFYIGWLLYKKGYFKKNKLH